MAVRWYTSAIKLDNKGIFSTYENYAIEELSEIHFNDLMFGQESSNFWNRVSNSQVAKADFKAESSFGW